MGQVTGRETDKEMNDIRRSAMTITYRWALIDALKTLHASPEDAADALLAYLFKYGGTLTIAGDHMKLEGWHKVLLRLHGLTVGGECLEGAALNWLNSARASLNEGAGA